MPAPDFGDVLSLEKFSTLPYLAYQAGTPYSLVESQLDVREIARNTMVATETFALAPFLMENINDVGVPEPLAIVAALTALQWQLRRKWVFYEA